MQLGFIKIQTVKLTQQLNLCYDTLCYSSKI